MLSEADRTALRQLRPFRLSGVHGVPVFSEPSSPARALQNTGTRRDGAVLTPCVPVFTGGCEGVPNKDKRDQPLRLYDTPGAPGTPRNEKGAPATDWSSNDYQAYF